LHEGVIAGDAEVERAQSGRIALGGNERLDVRMAVSPPSDPDAGSVDADVDAGSTLDAGTSDPDGGIPPLADPDAGSGG